MNTPNILEINVYDPVFENQFLLVGSCVERLYPEILDKYKSEWINTVSYCLEREHYNMLFAKLVDILALGKTNKVGILTVDGSPHCIQMHFVNKYLTRALKIVVEFEHFVIDPDGQTFNVSSESIDQSKQLASLGSLL